MAFTYAAFWSRSFISLYVVTIPFMLLCASTFYWHRIDLSSFFSNDDSIGIGLTFLPSLATTTGVSFLIILIQQLPISLLLPPPFRCAATYMGFPSIQSLAHLFPAIKASMLPSPMLALSMPQIALPLYSARSAVPTFSHGVLFTAMNPSPTSSVHGHLSCGERGSL